MLSIFKTFFLLGWISFGGPAAHIGYFRNTFVEKLNWLSDEEYGQIVALSQFLPGPGSSQVGFAVGYKKGGLTGAIAAFVGFTSPSVILMLILALVSNQLLEAPLFNSIIHGLKLLAVVVVADATFGMYKNFCQSKVATALCVITAIVLLLVPGIWPQVLVLLFAATVGSKFLTSQKLRTVPSTHKISITPLVIFVALLVCLPLFSAYSQGIEVFGQFYQAGSLVFGGGHVVLPLLQNGIGDQLSQDAFLTGYAAAQAVPGPMFTLATYLGYVLMPSAPITGALLATIAVFLPGFLLLLGVLKNWQAIASKPMVAGALSGVNAAVVGLLLAALYQPIFTSAVSSGLDFTLIIVGIWLLKSVKLSIVGLVGAFMLFGFITGL
ncbi:chromate efflux transporter [Vibrio kanaloae]|uniref:Chromate efflux transporter n=1 Tax=Vibrio kanaloae TaxID=170673 RepID=A0A4U1YZ30_9VIBR|nr:chromate efflux transporter [Vibrio kanaloae]QPK03541.1 chromate efflux transporter [Vibrio kanaloae]TKF26983.1 chromate efflux transporter [Vibrio kanaloae]